MRHVQFDVTEVYDPSEAVLSVVVFEFPPLLEGGTSKIYLPV